MKISLNKGVPAIQCLDSVVIGFMTNHISRARVYQVYQSYISSVEDLSAYSDILKENKPVRVKVERFDRRANLDRSIFYDDTEEISFTFPATAEGVKSYVTYKQNVRDAFFIPPFYFGSYLPVAKSVYQVVLPASVKINYRLFNTDSTKVKFTTTSTGKNTIYKWQMDEVNEIRSEDDGADEAFYQPHVIVTIDEVSGEKFLSDYNQLAKWCSSFVKDLNQKPAQELQGIVSSVTSGATNDIDKCRSIYKWVQQNINYVAFEDSIYGFRPREAADVCHKRYGDCKDMASLIYSMCRMAGIKAYYAWIGTSDKPYSHFDIASPILYNHMICIAEVGDKKIVLDGTGKFSPFDYPTPFIQNKEALYVNDEGKPIIYKLPVVDASQNYRSDSVSITLGSNCSLSGSLKSTLAGYKKMKYLYAVKYNDINNIRLKILGLGNDKFRIDSIAETGLDDNSAREVIDIKFTLDDYVVKAGEKLYLNLNLNKKGHEQKVSNPSRIVPKVMDYKHTDKLFVKFKIPENYELDYLPSGTLYADSIVRYSIHYTADKEYITLTSEIEINSILLSKENFADWNKALSKLSKDVSQNVVLRPSKL
ncbi:MAG TPA: transglutaminase domain-containing protein [Chitinophagales bacterium]|nr:transglutaminase domain-containing protein [Chitinophagales bacterium]